MSTSILGIGTVSAFGSGIDTLRAGLEGKKQPLIKEHHIDTSGGIVSLPVYTAAIEGLDRFVPRRALRRLDRFIKMALLASNLALEESGVTIKERTRIGIVFGTGYGPLQTTFDFLDSVIDYGDTCASPTLFATSVHNSPVAHVSIFLNIQGPSLTLTCFEDTTLSVLSTARSWLEHGLADYVIAGAGDEYCDVRGYATVLSGAKKMDGIRPFCFDDCSYLPGEGFAAFLLGNEPSDNAYCTIEQIHHNADTQDLPEILFLAANGAEEKGTFYKQAMSGNKQTAAYSPLYGSMPTGNGFDVAIAALSLKERVLYPTPDPSGGDTHTLITAKAPILTNTPIGCLHISANNSSGLLTLNT